MASVGTKDKVIDFQVHTLTNGGSFLSHRKVGRSLVIIFDSVPGTLGFESIQHAFKFTDGHHVIEGSL